MANSLPETGWVPWQEYRWPPSGSDAARLAQQETIRRAA